MAAFVCSSFPGEDSGIQVRGLVRRLSSTRVTTVSIEPYSSSRSPGGNFVQQLLERGFGS
jgi:hypothetical protein